MQSKHEVYLSLVEDEKGTWGFLPRGAEEVFDSFYNEIGIFHDVFEHWFEGKHKYFIGDASFNIIGEIVAMGAMTYYYAEMAISERIDFITMSSPSSSVINTTFNEMYEAIRGGYTRYGSTLWCEIPKQKPVLNGELEHIIEKHWEKLKNLNVKQWFEYTDKEEYYAAVEFKKSCTKGRIRDAYRYGYRLAEKLVPNTSRNAMMIGDFILYFKEFTKQIDVEELSRHFRGITFNLFEDEEKNVTWRATLDARYPYEDAVIDVDTKFYLEDYESEQEEKINGIDGVLA